MPAPPTALTPPALARGRAVVGAAAQAARAAADLPTPAADVAAARAAVREPAAESAARAREELAAELGRRPMPSPEIVALAGRIRRAIRENRPENENELLRTDPTSAARAAGATVTASVEGQVAGAAGAYDALATPPAGAPTRAPVPVDPPSAASPGFAVAAAQAAPDPVPPQDLTLDADVAATDRRIADSGIDTPVSREVPDGPFERSRRARGELGDLAQRAPAQIAAEHSRAIDRAQADLTRLQGQAVAALRSGRGSTVAAVAGRQSDLISAEEQLREAVGQRARADYDEARTQVEALLQPLARTALARWDAGLASLSLRFRDRLARVQAWVDERHAGALGAIVALGDYVVGLPSWVSAEYVDAEREFGDGVVALLESISADVDGVVLAAQGIVRRARVAIDGEFGAMERRFPAWAERERARFAGLLDGLDGQIAAARTGFVRDVSVRAVAAVNEVHATAQAARQAAGGLIGEVVAAIEEFAEDPVRAIIDGLLRLVGIPPAEFWSLLQRIEHVMADIADDPERFVNTLVAGLRAGFERFFENFGGHVLRGFWDWLCSGLKTSVPLPTEFTPLSLARFALELMGITWPRVREVLIEHLGPQAVEVIEQAWRLISALVERGPAGIVELIRDKLSPATMIEAILEAAVEYLVETLIKQVAVRVVAMLNPVGAVAAAIDLIYQVCAWVFRNAARIFRFVQAVVDGVADVVAGKVAGLAAGVERALATLVGPVIDFLAGLLHLGGLPDQVGDVVVKLQTVALAALDAVVGFVAGRARALLRAAGVGGPPAETGPSETGPSAAAASGTGGSADGELGTTVRFAADGETHRTWIERVGTEATLMVASAAQAIEARIAEWRGKLATMEGQRRTDAEAALAALSAAVRVLDAQADALAPQFAAAVLAARGSGRPGSGTPGSAPPEHAGPDDSAIEAGQRNLAALLRAAFEAFHGNEEPQVHLRNIAKHIHQHGTDYARSVTEQWAPAVRRAKLDPPGTEALWPDSVLNAASGAAYLVKESTHELLLPWFLVGSRTNPRRAESGTFACHAFQTDTPDPPHRVRLAFIDELGRDAARRLREHGLAKVSEQENSALRASIAALRFTTAGGRWGAFVGLPVDAVNPLIKSAIAAAGGIEAFLRAMVTPPGEAGGITWAQFQSVLAGGAATRKYVKDLFRDLNPGHHEWIPTGYIPQVVEHAIATARAGGVRDALRWITAQNTLRSPTRYVLHPPRIVQVAPAPKPAPKPAPAKSAPRPQLRMEFSGHVGAFYTADADRKPTGTIGMEAFHDWLRTEFDAHKARGPLEYIRRLQSQLRHRVWDGRLDDIPVACHDQRVGMLFDAAPGELLDLTVAQLAVRQRLNWRRIEDNFDAAYAATEKTGS